MKTALFTLLVIFALAATIVMLAQPEIPTSTCAPKNDGVSKFCLSSIRKYYDADHLTYTGHTKAWIYRGLNKLGIGLTDHQTKALMKYSSFEDAVNCYLTASGDAGLNMTISPAEFSAKYDQLSKDFAIQ